MVPAEINMINLMKEFHWTYEDYMNTPAEIIDIIVEKENIDYQYNKMQNGGK